MSYKRRPASILNRYLSRLAGCEKTAIDHRVIKTLRKATFFFRIPSVFTDLIHKERVVTFWFSLGLYVSVVRKLGRPSLPQRTRRGQARHRGHHHAR